MYRNISEQFKVHREISICVQSDSATITESLLYAEELEFISPTWSEKRKKTFVLGRLAAKQALATYGIEACPILRGVMNEPVWPDSFKGSIAHKDNIAIAAVTKDDSYAGIGIDIEETGFLLDSTHAQLFCGDDELDDVAKNPLNAVLFFSIKESVIKAYYMAFGKLTEMRDVSCRKLLYNSSCSNIKVKYILVNQHIISLCMIHNTIKEQYS